PRRRARPARDRPSRSRRRPRAHRARARGRERHGLRHARQHGVSRVQRAMRGGRPAGVLRHAAAARHTPGAPGRRRPGLRVKHRRHLSLQPDDVLHAPPPCRARRLSRARRLRPPAVAARHGGGQRARAAEHGRRPHGAGGGDRRRRRRARRVSPLRFNVLVLGTDYGLFMVGLTFASQSTILPAFAAWLGAPNVLIGAIPAVMTLGWFLPSLFAAGYTETLTRKLPFIMRWTAGERVPFLVMALLAFFTAERWPNLTLGLMLLMLLLITGVGGVLMPAWMDLIARTLPTTIRGRFFALSNLVARGLAMTGSMASGFYTVYALRAWEAPAAQVGVFTALMLVGQSVGTLTL